jgi:DNA adenine methylase
MQSTGSLFAAHERLPEPRPFLKWVGGKTQLLEQFEPLLPREYGRYFEPFVGGAALFFKLRPPTATLVDMNSELIDCYLAIRDDVDGVIGELEKHRYEAEHYYAVRELDPLALSLKRRAARTIFLNKTGFNGLYRVNRGGRFNVPFGRHNNPSLGDPASLRACSAALRGVSLYVGDFASVLDDAQAGDFVYFDPPYVPLSETSDFTGYVAGGFGWEQQERLAEVFAKLAERDVRVMLSNSDVPRLRKLYAGFQIDVVQAARNINSNTARRGKIAEVVIRSYGGSKPTRIRPRRG